MCDTNEIARDFNECSQNLRFSWQSAWHGIAHLQCRLNADPDAAKVIFGGMPGMKSEEHDRDESLVLSGEAYGVITMVIFVSLFAKFEDTLRRLSERVGIGHGDPFGLCGSLRLNNEGNWLKYRSTALRSAPYHIDIYAGLPTGVGESRIIERGLVRNCIMHNGAKADDKLVCEQDNPETTYKPDQPISITPQYLLDSFEWLSKVVGHLASELSRWP